MIAAPVQASPAALSARHPARLTRGVTRQIQKIMILAWRREWKRALAEYDEAHPEGGAAGAVVVGREQASGA